jgi:hypothetical protein
MSKNQQDLYDAIVIGTLPEVERLVGDTNEERLVD